LTEPLYCFFSLRSIRSACDWNSAVRDLVDPLSLRLSAVAAPPVATSAQTSASRAITVPDAVTCHPVFIVIRRRL